MPAPKPKSRPRSRQWAISVPAASRIAIAILTARSAGSGHGTGSLKNTMIPSPENWSSVPSNWLTSGPKGAVVLAQETEDFLGLGGLGKGGVAAQIAEHDDDLTAMAFEDLFVALRDDQFGQLRRQKPLQPSDAPQLLDLLGNPRLQPAVQLGYLIGALAQFTQQPRILHRDDRLRCEVLQQRDFFIGKWPHDPSI